MISLALNCAVRLLQTLLDLRVLADEILIKWEWVHSEKQEGRKRLCTQPRSTLS